MAKVYSYVRMSTAEQIRGDSLRRQMDDTKAFAASLGLEVDEQLHDLGKSAFRGKNTDGDSALARFLELIDNHRVEPGSYLVVESLDRLSRQSVEVSFDLLRRIISKGVMVVTLKPHQIYRSDSFQSITPLLLALTAMVRAHEESSIKSERVAKAWKQKKLRAANLEIATKRIPAWLQLTNDGIAPIEERADIVRKIFTMVRDGWGAFSIARELNQRGIPAWSTRKRAVWRESYIKKLIHGRTVLGEYHPHRLAFSEGRSSRVPDGDPIPGYYPAIIDTELYEAARAAMSERRLSGRGRKGPEYANLFSGLLKCGMCGSGMIYINKGQPPKGGRYLRCSVAHAKGKKCSARAWRYELIETALLEAMDDLDVSYVLEGRTKEALRADLSLRASRIEDEIEMYEKRLARTADAIRLSNVPIPALMADSEHDQSQLNDARARRGELGRRISELDIFDPQTMRARLDDLLNAIGQSESNQDRRVEIRRALAAELRRSLDKIVIRGITRYAHEILDTQRGVPAQYDVLVQDEFVENDPGLLEFYRMSAAEFSELLRKLDFEFVFIYRNGREHHIDPVSRVSFNMNWSGRFSLFKEAVRLRDQLR